MHEGLYCIGNGAWRQIVRSHRHQRNTLAIGQVDFVDLPAELSKRLPRRLMPVAVLAWLAVSNDRQNQGLGSLLLAQALRDCHQAGKTFAFIAVILDCINDDAKAFYQKWDFQQLPGHPN